MSPLVSALLGDSPSMMSLAGRWKYRPASLVPADVYRADFRQAQLLQFAAESYRRQKHAPVGGIFQFMFNECWPSANWGVIDYWRRPKPGFAALATAYQPVLPSIAWTPGPLTAGDRVSADIWVVNDLWDRFDGAVIEWTLRSDKAVLKTERETIQVGADSAAKVMSFAMELSAARYEVLVALRDAVGRTLGSNRWTFTVEEH